MVDLKKFSIDDYNNLPLEKLEIVDKWAAKYNLWATDVEQVEPNPDDPIERQVRLRAYGPLFYRFITNKGEKTMVVTDSASTETDDWPLVKVAEFTFDDFPWEVLGE